MSMKVATLDSAWEPVFWDYVSRDVLEYYFFIFGWKFRRDQTMILLALKNDKIDGLMLIYRQRVVQLRGGLEAARLLINRLDLERADIQAFKEHEPIILTKYKPLATHEMILMALRKGEEKPYIKHPIVKLTPSDAEEIAGLMRLASPEFWAEITADQVIAGIRENTLWLGIKERGKIVSIGSTRLTDFACNIGTVATHEAYKGRGYATSIVSALVKEIFQKSELALIHVLSGNIPAIHAYTKVGFKPYRTYFFTRGEKRLS